MAWDLSIGSRVVCIDDDFDGPPPSFISFPVKGRTYTLRAIEPDPFDGEPVVLLEEIRNPKVWFEGIDGPREQAFLATRFRPVEDRRLDQFRAHLQPCDPAPTPRCNERETVDA